MGVVSDYPILPGYTGTKVPYGEFHHKQQTLSYEKGYAVRALLTQNNDSLDTHHPDTSINSSITGKEAPISHDAGSRLPKWVEYDRKVLRWFAYFREAVTESADEQYRIRRVTILYYLEDDTLEVTEPKQENSGILQGKFMKRHRIPKVDGTTYKPNDLVVGNEVVMYGRTFTIVGIDAHTRCYLDGLGITMAPDQPYPQSPYDTKHAAHGPGHPGRTAALGATKSGSKGSLKFLEDANKVLRFYILWDDRASLYGDRRPYRLHYFVEDGTCEILESLDKNSGRDPFPVFLRRGLFPKNGEASKPGFCPDPSMCYGPSDFRMGTCIAVYGRMFFIHDCDDFTRKWLKENMGSSDEELCAVEVTEPVDAAPAKQLPEYNGFGSLEDSAQNCTSLIPRPPRKDFYKLMNKNKAVLRFVCRLVEHAGAPTSRLSLTDGERRFVLSFFMADDTLAIFEPPLKNSGVVGGKYLERRQVTYAGTTRLITDVDLHVGAVVPILQRNFELLDADAFTFQYMENNRHLYVMADSDKALHALVTAAKAGNSGAFQQSEPSASDYMSLSQLQEAITSMGVGISKHQVISIYRRMPKDALQRASIISIQEALS